MEEYLNTLGLRQQERKIYLACLKLDSAKASTIAEHADIERQASYYVLRQLVKKAMITQSIKSGVTYYSCVNPKLLLEKIEEEKRIKKNAVKNLSKEYQKLKGVQIPKPRVELFEGIEGFKTAAREVINGTDKEVYSIISEKVIEFRPIFLDPYVKKRIEKGIRVKVITEKTSKSIDYKKEDKKALREIKFLDSIIKGKDYEMAVSMDKVIFIRVTNKEQIAIKIEDPYFAELQRNIFKLLWKEAQH